VESHQRKVAEAKGWKYCTSILILLFLFRNLPLIMAFCFTVGTHGTTARMLHLTAC
jgi:hypothetical protein